MVHCPSCRPRRQRTPTTTGSTHGAHLRGYGRDYEAEGLDVYEDETGLSVVRQHIRVTLPDGSIRYYDGLALKPDGTYEGIEVKGGSATLTPGQRAFDGQIESGATATGRLGGNDISVSSVRQVDVG